MRSIRSPIVRPTLAHAGTNLLDRSQRCEDGKARGNTLLHGSRHLIDCLGDALTGVLHSLLNAVDAVRDRGRNLLHPRGYASHIVCDGIDPVGHRGDAQPHVRSERFDLLLCALCDCHQPLGGDGQADENSDLDEGHYGHGNSEYASPSVAHEMAPKLVGREPSCMDAISPSGAVSDSGVLRVLNARRPSSIRC